MTVAAGYVDPDTGATWVGADTLGVSAGLRLPPYEKIICGHEWAIALAGDGRALNLLEVYGDELLHRCESGVELARRLRDMFINDGWDRDSRRYPIDHDQTFLAARPGELYCISSDYEIQVIPPRQLWAIGSGMEYALGAAYALQCKDPAVDGQMLIDVAIQAACAYDIYCGGEPNVRVLL